MVYMGRNLISKTTEGIWTKREPEVSHDLPDRFCWYMYHVAVYKPGKPGPSLLFPVNIKKNKILR